MALKSRNPGVSRYHDEKACHHDEAARETEVTGSSQLSTSSTRIVNLVPGNNHFERGSSSDGSASLHPNQVGRPRAQVSDDSSDGFSLADDAENSLPGSEGLSEGSQSGESSSNVESTSAASQAKDNLLTTLLPSSLRAVRRARRCFWMFWVAGTVSVTTSLWAMAENESEQRSEYMELRTDILSKNDDESLVYFEAKVDLFQQIWKSRLESKLQTMEALGTSMTSSANAMSMTWPYVNLPDFDRRAVTLQGFTFWMPMVSDGPDFEAWGDYSQEWQNTTNATDAITDIIFEIDRFGNIQAMNSSYPYYFPIWQQASIALPSLVNFNLLSHEQLGASVQAVVESLQPVLSPTYVNDDFTDDDFFLGSILTENQPTTFLFYPVFNDFAEDSSMLVGILATAVTWDGLLAVDSLGGGPDLRATIPLHDCSGKGGRNNRSVLLELGDERSVAIESISNLSDQQGTMVNLTTDLGHYGRPLKSDFPGACAYSLRLAEGQKERTSFLTDAYGPETEEEDRIPINIVAGVLIFAFTMGLAFWWFDRKVRYRDRAMTAEANRTRNMVTSFFPPQFHDRLFQSNTGDPSHVLSDSPILRKVEEAVSTFFEVPIKGENDEIPKEKAADGGAVSQVEASQEAELSASNRITRSRTSSNESFGQSNHSKPSSFRQGLMARTASMRKLSGGNGAEPPMQRLRNFMTSEANSLPAQSENGGVQSTTRNEPIADLFPDATVLFADISGFTAWSSTREPTQVFKLLETIYRGFDRIARKRKVFKVETIGDCYVAVTGLPEPQPDHAIIMAKFAKECMNKMTELTRMLEVSLGPETGDLCMRFGLHSGPVTAGVLRGEKSRFQLFGDTVNCASRMESTGQRNRIQGSQATADLLILSGRSNWIHPREELVNAKGKGQIQTYWINPRSNSSGGGSVRSLNGSMQSLGGTPMEVDGENSMIQLKSRPKKSLIEKKSSSHHSSAGKNLDMSMNVSRRSMLSSSHHSQLWYSNGTMDDNEDDDYDGFDDVGRQERLIDWNVEILAGFLKRIVAWRQARTGEVSGTPRPRRGKRTDQENLVLEKTEDQNALDEIIEIIPLAHAVTGEREHLDIDPSTVELSNTVESQLREYVTMIACMYRDNFFHNFEHASHVLMSAQKLLKRVLSADRRRAQGVVEDHTSIIASDPLTQFAIIFSALIHDVDHTGVPNAQLKKEEAHIATLYGNKSIAEQNSLDLAWDLLMSKEYRDLQRTIFSTQAELQRFRQLIVNVVLATDIFDPDMVKVRNSRWMKAFGGAPVDPSFSEKDSTSLKATVVIEYIMQASDISHTMQHWEVYQRWNERLFEEMYSAYQVRRGDKDPSVGWYKGELWFFDNYIIPLAKKLKECGVFGAASDQCLQYAENNRRDWELKGEEIVEQLVQRHAQPL